MSRCLTFISNWFSRQLYQVDDTLPVTFTDEETGTTRLHTWLKITQPISYKFRTQTQVCLISKPQPTLFHK